MTQPRVSDLELIREAYLERRDELQKMADCPGMETNVFMYVTGDGTPILAPLYTALKLAEMEQDRAERREKLSEWARSLREEGA